MPQTNEGILLVVGAIFFLIGLLGGGFEISAIKIPAVGNWPRILSTIVGTVFMVIAVIRLLFPPQPGVAVAPTPTVEVTVATLVDTPIPPINPSTEESSDSISESPTDTPEPAADTPTPKPTNTPEPTNTPTPTDTPILVLTNTPAPTNTSRPTPTPTATIDADPTMYDNFNNPVFDGQWNKSLWTDSSFPGTTKIEQNSGILTISRQSKDGGLLRSLKPGRWTITELGFVEAKIMLDSNLEASGGSVGIGIDKFTSQRNWWVFCTISGSQGNIEAWANCHSDGLDHGSYTSEGIGVQYNTWHLVRFEINPKTSVISFFIDGQQVGSYTPTNSEIFQESQFSLILAVNSQKGDLVTGYFDHIRIGQ